jgi:hypothetical protein
MRIILLLTLLAIQPAKSFAIASGIDGEDLADTPLSDAINMELSEATNQLSLTLAITPGTSATVDVQCYESVAGTTYSQISYCTNAVPAVCKPDVRRHTLSDYDTVGSVKIIATRWAVTKKFVKCSVDDPADGTGTVVVTGTRSWR